MLKINFDKRFFLSASLLLASACDKNTTKTETPVVKEQEASVMASKEPEAKKETSTPAKLEPAEPLKKENKTLVPKMEAVKPKTQVISPKIEVPKALTLKDVLSFESGVVSFKTVGVPFKEKLYRQLRKKTLYKEGFAYFVRPNKFVWQVGTKESSAKQYWIYNGKELIQKSSEDKQVARFDANVSKSQELNQLVSYFVNFKELFATHDLVKATEFKNVLQVTLKTKAQTNIEHIDARLDIREENNKRLVFLKSMQIFYRDKNHTTFDFEEFGEGLGKPSALSQEVLDYLK